MRSSIEIILWYLNDFPLWYCCLNERIVAKNRYTIRFAKFDFFGDVGLKWQMTNFMFNHQSTVNPLF